MFTKPTNEVSAVEWGSGTSHRLLVEKDNMGFAVADTVFRSGTESKLEYRNNLEVCYCIRGAGNVEDTEGNFFEVTAGMVYVLDDNQPHYLRASDHEDLELVSVFNPPTRGDEKRVLSARGFSTY
ncbi:ectoine synthase [Auritidibacter ignavus]|uniref:ectoine synthase n=1 Tax=Auritidibacter ignavus TaxID=678932 RepID=UPI00244B021E|nr:ectoine synthase [Auritidibacter ignavus]WGH83337.1 ectoine synthase [Auritidibacter ignavus]